MFSLFTNLDTNIVLGISPTALIHVPGESINHPIVEISGKATVGKLYSVTISSSPINAPPGIPDITVADNIETAIERTITSIWLKDIPNIENKKAILSIDAILDPSICIVEPIGSTTLLISSSKFISLLVFILTGRVASDEHVPSDVIVD